MKIIVVSNHALDYHKLKLLLERGEPSRKVCVCHERFVPTLPDSSFSSSFYIIDQTDTLQNIVSFIMDVVRASEPSEISILVHDGKARGCEHMNRDDSLFFEIKNRINESIGPSNEVKSVAFYHARKDNIWPCLERFIRGVEAYARNAGENAESSENLTFDGVYPEFAALVRTIVGRIESLQLDSAEQKLHIIRADCLSPLVALDLLNQAKLAANETELVKKIQQAIRKNQTDNKFSELVGLFKGEADNDILRGWYENLCEEALGNERANHEDYHEKLKQLAQGLEQRINP